MMYKAKNEKWNQIRASKLVCIKYIFLLSDRQCYIEPEFGIRRWFVKYVFGLI